MHKLHLPSSVGGPCWSYKGIHKSPLGCRSPVVQLYILVLYCILHGIGIGFVYWYYEYELLLVKSPVAMANMYHVFLLCRAE